MRRIFPVLGLVALLLAACGSSSHRAASTVHRYTVEGLKAGVGTCSADASTLLATYLDGLPDNSTVTLPHNSCFTIGSTLLLQGITGLTINGNGATLSQPLSAGSVPILEMFSDTNVKITGLTIQGAESDANPGGAGQEGNYGVKMEADTNVSLTGSTIENVQGDWVFLSQPYAIDFGNSQQLNTGITFSRDTFLNAGYHGFTVESAGCPTPAPCNGLTIANSVMTNPHVDAMDFEVDTFNSGINPSNGVPWFAAENYITVENNVWNNWGFVWFSAIQGQTYQLPISTTYSGSSTNVLGINTAGSMTLTDPPPTNTLCKNPSHCSPTDPGTIMTSAGPKPFTYTTWFGTTLFGVQITGGDSTPTILSGAAVTYGNECPTGPGYSAHGCGGVSFQHFILRGNTLNANSGLFEVVGTQAGLTTAPYLNLFWTITGNHFGPGFHAAPYQGGSTPAGQLYSVSRLNMQNNDFTFCPGGVLPCTGTPTEYVLDVDDMQGGTVANNNFTGALGTIEPQSYDEFNTNWSVCNNLIGTGSVDAAC